MIKRIMITLLLCIPAAVFAQPAKTVKLKATAGNITVRTFKVSTVVDDREDTTSIGTMRAGIRNKTAFVNLPDGATRAISEFMSTSVNQPDEATPIAFHILKLNVKESVKGMKEQADLSTQYGFFKNGKKIIDYSGTSYVQTGMDASPYIGKLVSQSIEQVLKEFDTWWAANQHLYDESKKEELKVLIHVNTTSTDTDEIMYTASRPLSLADFKGSPDNLSKALAATYSGFSLKYQLQGDHTGSTAHVEIKPYFDQSKSWIKPAGKIPYVLQHEQLHFDIAALKTCELIIAIKNASFTTSGFEESISGLQKKYSKEMEQMQAAYDDETSHGVFKTKQGLWQSRIAAALQEKAAAAGL